MKTTRYFDEQVRSRRPYLTDALCQAVLANPVHREAQSDWRLRFWGMVTLPDERDARILRVVTLDDGMTVHNAFLDRGFVRRET